MIQLASAAVRPAGDVLSDPDDPLSVRDLVIGSKRALEGVFGTVWVAGEISEWTKYQSGHRYFTLRDESAQVRAVMYRGDAARLPVEPEVGWEVLVHGTATVYEGRGTLQIRIRELRLRDDRGLHVIALERLRQRLREEGLLEPRRKRPLPPYPRRIGIVTSPNAAALQDVLTVLQRRWPCAYVEVLATRVQGPGADEEIARAIRAAPARELDVLIVTRGGGSADDLVAFDAECVARAIAACPVPTISAVGHETDTTTADLVADVRAPTPSAAAELVAPERSVVQDRLHQLAAERRERLDHILQQGEAAANEAAELLHQGLAAAMRLDEERLARVDPDRLAQLVQARIVEAESHALAFSPHRLLPPVCHALDRSSAALETVGKHVLRQAAGRILDGYASRIDAAGPARLAASVLYPIERTDSLLASLALELRALSPREAMKRGYVILLQADGRVLRSAAEMEPDAAFWVRMADGVIRAHADHIVLQEENHA